MSDLRHIYRNLKLKHIPSKRYNRKYDPKYLDELASKGCSVKLGFGDFDGDTDLDGTYPKQRAVVAEKPGLHINKPLRGPRNLSFPPSEGPVSLSGAVLPEFGPTQLSAISLPAFGPSQLSAALLPEFGPTVLSSNIQPPIEGPSLAEFPATPSGDRRVKIVKPALGPSNLKEVPEPQAGPISLSSTIVKPSGSISTLGANVVAPVSGPSNLSQIVFAPSGFNGSSLNLTSSIVAPQSGPNFPSSNSTQIVRPVSGVSGLTGQVFVGAPSVGPNQLSSAVSYDLVPQKSLSLAYVRYNIPEFPFGQMELSADGNTIAITRYTDSDKLDELNRGWTFVFERSSSSGSWSQKGSGVYGDTQIGHTQSPYTNQQDHVSLSADGNSFIVSSQMSDKPTYNSSGNQIGHLTNTGHFKVYSWDNSSSEWVKKGPTMWGDRYGDRMGSSIAISQDGSVVAVGAAYNYYDETNSNNNLNAYTGFIKIYEWNSSSWVQRGSTIFGANGRDYIGLDIDLSNNGSRLLQSNGDVSRVYEWNGSEYSQLGSSFTTPNSLVGDPYNYTGHSVRCMLSGDGLTAAVCGGIVDDEITRVFKWNGSSWVQKGSDFNFGTSVSLSEDGDILVVSEMGYGGTKQIFWHNTTYEPTWKGMIRVYKFENGDWALKNEVGGSKLKDVNHAMSLSKDGKTLAVFREDDMRLDVFQNPTY